MTNKAYQGRQLRTGNDHDENVLELEVRTDGGLHLISGSLSNGARRVPVHGGFYTDPDGPQLLDDHLLVTLTHRFLGFVTAAAHEAGYLGSWALAMGATGLTDTTSRTLDRTHRPGPPYPQKDYRQASVVTAADLATRPGATANHLVGPLLHTLLSWDHFECALTDAPPA